MEHVVSVSLPHTGALLCCQASGLRTELTPSALHWTLKLCAVEPSTDLNVGLRENKTYQLFGVYVATVVDVKLSKGAAHNLLLLFHVALEFLPALTNRQV